MKAKSVRQYIIHLPQVLRYTLQSNENQSICLFDEIEAAKSYIFMIKMRFDNHFIEPNINEAPRSKLTGYLHGIFYYSPQEAGYLPTHPLSAALFDYKISFRKLIKFKSHE